MGVEGRWSNCCICRILHHQMLLKQGSSQFDKGQNPWQSQFSRLPVYVHVPLIIHIAQSGSLKMLVPYRLENDNIKLGGGKE